MEAHRIRERRAEQAVVALHQVLQHRPERGAFVVVEVEQGGHSPAGDDERFERPHGPVRYDRHEVVVLLDDPLPLVVQVVEQDSGTLESLLLARDDRGHVLGRPDLPVRVRIARAHLRSSIFEDLDMSDVRVCAELLVLLRPGLDDLLDRFYRKVSETEVMAW